MARLPIAALADPANRMRVRHPRGCIGPAFSVAGLLVWGFTAGVLATLLEMGGWARPWDTVPGHSAGRGRGARARAVDERPRCDGVARLPPP